MRLYVLHGSFLPKGFYASRLAMTCYAFEGVYQYLLPGKKKDLIRYRDFSAKNTELHEDAPGTYRIEKAKSRYLFNIENWGEITTKQRRVLQQRALLLHVESRLMGV